MVAHVIMESALSPDPFFFSSLGFVLGLDNSSILFLKGVKLARYWHVMVFTPYKYVYNLNITDTEKPQPVILCTFYIFNEFLTRMF